MLILRRVADKASGIWNDLKTSVNQYKERVDNSSRNSMRPTPLSPRMKQLIEEKKRLDAQKATEEAISKISRYHSELIKANNKAYKQIDTSVFDGDCPARLCLDEDGMIRLMGGIYQPYYVLRNGNWYDIGDRDKERLVRNLKSDMLFYLKKNISTYEKWRKGDYLFREDVEYVETINYLKALKSEIEKSRL